MTLRCVLDGLLMYAEFRAASAQLVVHDGDESFGLEAVEALYYELVEATDNELRLIQRFYRLLRRATDFQCRAA